MIYQVIGTMSGSSLDGLDIVFAQITNIGDTWEYEIQAADCMELDGQWRDKLRNFEDYNAREFARLDVDFGYWMGDQISNFITQKGLEHKVFFIGSHGHTAFHAPDQGWTSQIGHGGAIASRVNLPVINDIRMMDVTHGGQGAPVVPIAEKLLFPEYSYFLNLGGICNVSIHQQDKIQAFDVTACNRVLNLLAQKLGKNHDEGGQWAREGALDPMKLSELNSFDYFQLDPPKSLANEFGIEELYPLVHNMDPKDALHTFTEHIAYQIAESVKGYKVEHPKMLITGGGAYNAYLLEKIAEYLKPLGIEVIVPDDETINYKEALAMALMAVLRWREEANVLSSYSGSKKDTIGGALWMV